MDEKVEFRELILSAVSSDELVLNSLCVCVRHTLQLSLALRMAVKEVVALSHDLFDEVLAVNALGVLMRNQSAILQSSRSTSDSQCLVVLIHFNKALNWLSGWFIVSD